MSRYLEGCLVMYAFSGKFIWGVLIFQQLSRDVMDTSVLEPLTLQDITISGMLSAEEEYVGY